ncbi:DNA translocase FtsK [Alkaliphilus sp. B6464]|uniref:DNA translocase FtsK n=1 Tax=Alkaliphilus sp. B6464 TaxID=2731219 RepID=UPI001BA8E79D|nr:DNA translocase FtsK [Alkaliphilus sp. B6464]QUH20782.1 DNA translocase FtsK [Alkaliphilus sp. B6464]
MGRKHRKKQSQNIDLIAKEFNNEIYGIFTIAIGLILLVIIQGNSAGKVGDFIRFLLTGLFSSTTVILPYITILCGVFIFINKSLLKENKTILFYCLVFISITILKSLRSFGTIDSIVVSNTTEWLQQIFTLGTQGIGGGIIGISLTKLLVNLFGITITYIIILTLLLISLILYTKISLLTMIVKLKNQLILTSSKIKNQILNFVFVPVKDTKPKNKKKGSKNLLTMDLEENIHLEKDSGIEEKIKILDFTTIDSDKPLENGKDTDDKTDIINQEDNDKKISKSIDSGTIINYNQETPKIEYEFPNIDLLNQIVSQSSKDDKRKIISNAKILEDTLLNFGVEAKVIQVNKGPAITRYELQPSAGVKVSKIVNLSDDIALNLAAQAIRIEAPIPGKAAIGIEIPNEDVSTVALREVLDSPNYKNSNLNLPFALGKDVSGAPIITDISKMPHLLVAGATGSGKSVCINTLILSILYNSSPDMVRLVLIDPKVVELSQYNGIPHLLIPVVTDPKKATSALNWAVQEMSKRYKMFAENGVRDIDGYNKKFQENKIPYIVIIIDELADLMMVAPNDVEDTICRLAQMARAAGLHLIIATQRPSVDVITGVIKANIPSRIAFAVASQADSRTILDMGGAEKLLGKGDMLFYPVGSSKPVRVQGAFISEKEVERVVTFIKDQVEIPNYEDEIIDQLDQNNINMSTDVDELFNEALKIVIEGQQASISMLQRRLRIGYNRAARLIDEMESKGFVGPHEGSKPRQVLIDNEFFEQNIKESI